MHPSDVLVSLSGVVLIVGLVWWAMGSAVARIGDERAARERIAEDHPDFAVDRLLISSDGRSALALSADAREAVLLFALGTRITTWRMPRSHLHAELREVPSVAPTLVVDTADFTLPHLRLELADPAIGREMAARLGARVTA